MNEGTAEEPVLRVVADPDGGAVVRRFNQDDPELRELVTDIGMAPRRSGFTREGREQRLVDSLAGGGSPVGLAQSGISFAERENMVDDLADMAINGTIADEAAARGLRVTDVNLGRTVPGAQGYRWRRDSATPVKAIYNGEPVLDTSKEGSSGNPSSHTGMSRS